MRRYIVLLMMCLGLVGCQSGSSLQPDLPIWIAAPVNQAQSFGGGELTAGQLTVPLDNKSGSVSASKVFVAEYSECYHAAGCHYLAGGVAGEMSVSEAIKQGYRACSYCIK